MEDERSSALPIQNTLFEFTIWQAGFSPVMIAAMNSGPYVLEIVTALVNANANLSLRVQVNRF